MKLQSLVNSSAGDLRELIIFRLSVLVWRVYVLRRMRYFLSIRLKVLMLSSRIQPTPVYWALCQMLRKRQEPLKAGSP